MSAANSMAAWMSSELARRARWKFAMMVSGESLGEAGEDHAYHDPVTTIHEAQLATGPSGAVEYGLESCDPRAVASRKNGEDIVVRRNDTKLSHFMGDRQ